MPMWPPPPSAYPYLITAICFSIQALGVGTYIAFGVFFNPLMEEFGWSRAAIAGASSTAFFSMGIFGVAIGRLNDSFGPRRLMSAAALLLGVGCILTGRLTSLWELYLYYGIIFGMGLSAIDVIALTTIARWFSHRRGFMTGIVKVGTGAGQFAIPLAASALILLYGWRWTIAIIGAVVALVLVLMAQLLRRDPDALVLKNKPPANTRGLAALAAGSSLPLARVFRTLQFWTICLLNFFLVSCLMVVLLHIVPHVRDSGIPPVLAAGVLSTIGGVSMLGRFASGLVIDRRGSKTVMGICFLLLLGDLVWLQFADRLWMFYLFGIIYGLAHGGFFTAISPLVAEWFGIHSHGTLFGIVVCFGTLGGALGPLLAGRLFDLSGSYQSTFWILIGLALVAGGLLLSLRPVKAR
ncbi:MAG: MFS transporter [Desulfobacterales bacterium]|jgi:MFS family permease|nr:MFS transporter [Desulfobacterales bacterium]